MSLRLISNGYLPIFHIFLSTQYLSAYRWEIRFEVVMRFYRWENPHANQNQPWRYSQPPRFLPDDFDEIPF